MTTTPSRARWQLLGSCILLIWGGLTIGIAFIATPAKFLATTLSWAGWLDVGRHTFAVYNRIELVIVAVVLIIALRTRQQALIRAVAIPAIIVLTETLWLLPALDYGVVAFIEGKQALPELPLHYVYIAVETVKTIVLIFCGWRLLNAAPLSSDLKAQIETAA